MAQIEEPTKKLEIESLITIINKEIKKISDEVDELLKNYNGNVKDFALKYSKNKLFPIAVGVINGRDKIDLIKRRIKTNTKNLMAAKKWLDSIK